MKKAQSSLEYLILIGILLVITIPLFYYAINKSYETIKINQAEDFVSSLTKAADEVYSLSPGTKKHIIVNIPGGTQNIEITENEISQRKNGCINCVCTFLICNELRCIFRQL